VIQDVPIPIENASKFLEFFHREIGIRPVWICPVKAYDPQKRFSLWPADPDKLYINFGFWDVVRSRRKYPAGFFNRKIERKALEMGGVKSLYSDVYFNRDEFWKTYNKPAYDQLKSRYDAGGAFKDLYQKTVLRN
jgi:FAD/FMN-containing dehydrogenase